MPAAGVDGAAAAAVRTASARGDVGAIEPSPTFAASPGANPVVAAVVPAAAGTGGGGSAASERTMEVMRADWQMLWA